MITNAPLYWIEGRILRQIFHVSANYTYAKKKQVLAQSNVPANVFLQSAHLHRSQTASWERSLTLQTSDLFHGIYLNIAIRRS